MSFQFKLDNDLNLYYFNNDSSKNEPFFKINSDNIHFINKYSKESNFGSYNDKKNVYDPKYRSSREILAENLCFLDRCEGKITKTATTEKYNELMTKLNDILKRNVYIVPYKLNVYTTGDFFKMHVDTPKGPNNIGTLLVGLSSDYEGGTLAIVENNDTKSFKINKNDCVFLYGDQLHQVLEVTSGTRLVMAFDVFTEQESEKEQEQEKGSDNAVEEPKGSAGSEEPDEESEVSDEEPDDYRIDEIKLDNHKGKIKDDYIGIALNYSYSVYCPGQDQRDITDNPEYLKGSDYALFKFFSKRCNYYKIVEYAKWEVGYRQRKDSEDSGNSDGSICWESHNNDYIAQDRNEDEGYDFDVSMYNLHLVGSLKSESDDYCDHKSGYMGNEYCDAFSYYGSMILLLRKSECLKALGLDKESEEESEEPQGSEEEIIDY
jgi:hypothetical protein